MRAHRQTTLAKPVSLAGVGLHSGTECRAVLRPASAGSGVSFRRVGAGGDVEAEIRASVSSVAETRLCTCLANDSGRTIATVEHLLAAIAVTSVDNMIVDVDGDELPILDGSAAPFVEAIERAGVETLAAARSAIRVREAVEARDGDRLIRIEPLDRRVLDIEIDFDDPAIGAQSMSIDLDDPAAMRRLSHARTFCRLADVTAMRAAGLSLGGSLDNAIVIDGDRILNPTGLRDPKEFVLHKALDLLGDLRLAEVPIIGRITARRPGHDLNARFLKGLLAERGAYDRVLLDVREARISA